MVKAINLAERRKAIRPTAEEIRAYRDWRGQEDDEATPLPSLQEWVAERRRLRQLNLARTRRAS